MNCSVVVKPATVALADSLAIPCFLMRWSRNLSWRMVLKEQPSTGHDMADKL